MRMVRVWLVVALLAAAVVASCGDDGGKGSALMDAADGKLAPAGADMKWEQEIAETTTPAHVIRRYTWDEPPAEVRRYYASELEKRGWSIAPGAEAQYAEWSHEGMIISLVLEPSSSGGSEWSLALFAAD